MTKTQEELNTLKQEYETLNNKLKELTDDELQKVSGGGGGSKIQTNKEVYVGNQADEKRGILK